MLALFGIDLDSATQAAVVAAIPATIAATAAWRSARYNRKQMATSNGNTPGYLLEHTHTMLTNHISDSWLHRGY